MASVVDDFGNYFRKYIQPHVYVIGATAVGVYFITPMVAPSAQATLSTFGASPAATNAILAGSYAGIGVAAFQYFGYSV